MHVYSPIYTVLPFKAVYGTAGKTIDEVTIAANVDCVALFKYIDGEGWKTILKLSDASPSDELFFAVVKINKDGKYYLHKSTGQKFKKTWIDNTAIKDYTPAVDLRFTVSLVANQSLVGVDGIKLEFINSETLYQFGDSYTKFYPIDKDCIAPCTDPCDTTYTNLDLYKALLPNMKADIEDGLLSIEYLKIATTESTRVNGVVPYDSAITALKAAASGAAVSMVLKANSLKVYEYGKVNLKYAYPRQTMVTPMPVQTCNQLVVTSNAGDSLTTIFKDGGNDVIVIPKFAYEQGNGYDLKQVEYMGSHSDGARYPIGEYYFTENGRSFLINENLKYHQYIINRGNIGESGMETFKDAMTDIFVIDNTTASVGFNAVLQLESITSTDKTSVYDFLVMLGNIVEAPPIEDPPIEAPPIEAPPIEAPPIEDPPIEDGTED